MSSIRQASSSSSNFQLIINALADYAKLTGIDLTKSPSAEKIERSNSPEAILELLQEREKAFKEYREVGRRLISCLNPTIKVLHAFSGILGEAVSMVSVTVDLLIMHMVIVHKSNNALGIGGGGVPTLCIMGNSTVLATLWIF